MKHLLPMTSRAAILALMLLAIAASPALASGAKPPKDTLLPPALRDSFPSAVSYPMTRMTPVADSALVARMTALLLIQDKVPAKSRTSHTWWISGPQPFMESLFPGSRWLLAEKHENPVAVTSFGEYSPQLEFLILYKDHFYRRNQLNLLWDDAGLSFDTTRARTLAGFSVLMAAFADPRHMRWPNPNTHVELQIDTAFPPLTILTYRTMDTLLGSDRGKYPARCVMMDVVYRGSRQQMLTEFSGPDEYGRASLMSVSGAGLRLLFGPHQF